MTEKTEKDIARQIRTHLRFATLYFFYSSKIEMTHPQLTDCMYPFTPVELQPGVLIVKERILTARSGTFGWGDRSRARVRVFDADGREQAADGRNAGLKETTVDGERRYELKLPSKWVACLERKTR